METSLVMKVKEKNPKDIFHVLLGRLGVDVNEELLKILEQSSKDNDQILPVETNNNNDITFQISLSLLRGTIKILPFKDLRNFFLVTSYEGIEVEVSKNVKCLSFETHIQNCALIIQDATTRYEILKRFEENSQQKLVKLVYEKSLTKATNIESNTKEKIKASIAPVVFVFCPNIFQHLSEQFQVKNWSEFQNIINLEKFNALAAASEVIF